MFEAKYSQYIHPSKSRFAYKNEITGVCAEISKGSRSKGAGAVLYYEDGKLYVDDSDTHYYIEGETGSKKSRVESTNIAKSIIRAKENGVVNDPKGELYKNTAGYAKLFDYNIKVLNFRDFKFSNSWNPLHLAKLYEIEGKHTQSSEVLDDFKDAIVAPLINLTNDRYWGDMAGSVFSYSSKILVKSVPDNVFNIASIIQFSDQENLPILRELMQRMDKTSETTLAMKGIVNLSAEKTLDCIFSTVQQMYLPFIRNKALMNLLSSNDIDFQDLVDKKTIIYVIYPDEKNGYDYLVNLFFSQCYQYLIDYSTKYDDGKLKRRVNFLLDEFNNLPPIEKFANKISEARGHNVRYFLFGQSFGQLKKNYKENAQTIIDNCNWIVFTSKDMALFERVSEMCGKEIDSYGKERSLIEACDLLHLKKYKDGAEALIIKNGQFPFVTKLPDYEYIDVFEKAPESQLKEIRIRQKPKCITFNKWISGLGSFYEYP